MRLLLLNYPYLARELKAMGMEVFSIGLTEDCDLTLELQEYNLDIILRKIPFAPDWIIFMDSVDRVIPRGLEDSPFPLAACFIDSRINRFWQRSFSRLFDRVMFDQKSDAEYCQHLGMDARWFPLAADTDIYHDRGLKKEFDISFIGSRNPNTRIKRENILNKLASAFNLEIFDGNPPVSASEAAEIYNKSRLVLNENLFPSVNLRLFEAMASGTALLTEENGDGLRDILRDGKYLVSYNPDNLIDKVKYYLASDRERENLTERGRGWAAEKHSFSARAGELVSILKLRGRNSKRSLCDRQLSQAETLTWYYMKWPERDPDALRHASSTLEMITDRNAKWYDLAGSLKLLTGDIVGANEAFKYFAELADTDFLSQLKSGLSSWQTGDRKKAGEALERAGQIAIGSMSEKPELPVIPKEPGKVEFHLFWGDVFSNLGLPFNPGLMMFDKPVHFWTALEHYAAAATQNPEYYERLGDHLMENGVVDQALAAYNRCDKEVHESKIDKARRLSYY